jgi:hypothetical protein
MTKLVLLTIVAVFRLTNVNAQEIKLGIKGGVNFSEINLVNSQNRFKTTNFNLGLLAEIPISEKFYFQPELLYSTHGGSSINLNYFNIPLMGKYYLTKGLSIEAGPQVGFLLSAKTGDRNIKSSFKNLDFGANFGVRYELKNGLNFGARYSHGLSKINNTNAAAEYSNNKYRNAVFQFTVGYFFF